MTLFPVLADVLIDGNGLALLGAGVGAGLVCIGAAKGIGHLAGQAVDGIARQPEAGGRIFTSMLIAAALIEGFTFFALVICNGIGGKLVDAIGAVAKAATGAGHQVSRPLRHADETLELQPHGRVRDCWQPGPLPYGRGSDLFEGFRTQGDPE